MQNTLKPGLTHRLSFKVGDRHTVPGLYPESPMFQAMPEVFATGYMVGLFEWCCTELLNKHLDPGEGSLGVRVNFTHLAATPPGLTVTVDCECIAVNGKTVSFNVRGHDGIDLIGEGQHDRAVVNCERFNARAAEKARAAVTASA
jgi:fluoroacetyl-CoA thioesterase